MSRIYPKPRAVWLLPPSLREELGDGHLAGIRSPSGGAPGPGRFEAESSEHGRPGYPPQFVVEGVAVRLRVGCDVVATVGAAASRDLGFSFLAVHLQPIIGTLNEFRKQHHGR